MTREELDDFVESNTGGDYFSELAISKCIKYIDLLQATIEAQEIIIKDKSAIMEDMAQAKTCENCKYYDGTHLCKNKNSISYGSNNRVYPYDGCKEDYEPKVQP